MPIIRRKPTRGWFALGGGSGESPVPPTPKPQPEQDEYFYIVFNEQYGGPTSFGRKEVLGRKNSSFITYFSDDKETWEQLSSATFRYAPAGRKIYIKSECAGWEGQKIVVNTNYSVGGNLASLLFGDDFQGKTITKDNTNANTFKQLFYNTGLTDCSKLYMPIVSARGAALSQAFAITHIQESPLFDMLESTIKDSSNIFSENKDFATLWSNKDIIHNDGWTDISPTGTIHTKAGSQWTAIPDGWQIVYDL